MLSVSTQVSKASLARVKLFIDRRIADIVAKAGTKIYNLILTGDMPYWSGAYAASWRYNFGSVDGSHAALPTNSSGKPSIRHAKQRIQSIIPNYSSPYMGLYISNSVPYAGKVEFEGTPTHVLPWKVATNAANAFRYGV